MRQKIVFIGILVSITFIQGCFLKKELNKPEKLDIEMNKGDEHTFYYAFTEATKKEIFQNFGQAETLYKECLNYDDSSAATLYQLSRISFIKRNFQQAIEYGHKAERIAPDNIWYKLNLARIYELTGKKDSVKKVYNRIVQRFEEKFDFAVGLAKLYYQDKEYDKAMEACHLIEKRYGFVEDISKIKLSIFIANDEIDKAEKEINQLIKLDSTNGKYYLSLAEGYASNEQMRKADSIYKVYFNLFGRDNFNARRSYANYLKEKGKKLEAYDILMDMMKDTAYSRKQKMSMVHGLLFDREALENDRAETNKLVNIMFRQMPDETNARALMADYYIRIDSTGKAIDHIKFLIRHGDDNYLVWEQLIYLLGQQMNYDSIYKYSRLGIEEFPDKKELYLYKGMAGVRIDSTEEAIRALNKGLELVDTNRSLKASFLSFLGEAYNDKARYKESDTAFEQSIRLDPDDCTVLNNYSYYLSLRKEKLDRAEKLIKKCLEKEKYNFVYLDTYGWILYMKNKLKKAEKYIELSLQYGGDKHADILDHYGDIKRDKGEYKEAIKYWKQAIELMDGDAQKIQEKINQYKNK